MKVCLLHRLFPPNSGGVGGIVPYYVAMARALRDAGHDVYVFTEATAHARGLSRQDGLTVFRLPKPPAQAGIAREVLQLGAIARNLKRFVERFRIEVVEAADFGGETAFLRTTRFPSAISVKLHTPMRVKDAVVGKHPVPRDRIVYAIEKRAILGANFLTTPSEASAARTREVFEVPSLRAEVVRNPLDLDEWKPADDHPRSRVVLYVGRFEPYKGPDRLAPVLNRVLRRFPDVIAQFVGDDSAFPGMIDAVKATLDPAVRARVSISGPVSRPELVKAYQSATVCLVPSRFEAFCYVCAEAMACALPVVASRGTAMDELIRDPESGYLTDYDNVDVTAARIEELLADDDLAARIGTAARQRITALCAPPRVVAQWEAAVAVGLRSCRHGRNDHVRRR